MAKEEWGLDNCGVLFTNTNGWYRNTYHIWEDNHMS